LSQAEKDAKLKQSRGGWGRRVGGEGKKRIYIYIYIAHYGGEKNSEDGFVNKSKTLINSIIYLTAGHENLCR